MTEIPDATALTRQDEEHLKGLAIGFRVVGGLVALCVNIFWVHVAMGLSMAIDPSKWGKDAPPPFLGYAFALFPLVVILAGWVIGALGFTTARNLDRRTGWSFCFAMSILYLLAQPLGTILGVLAIIVLIRPQVKAAFGMGS